MNLILAPWRQMILVPVSHSQNPTFWALVQVIYPSSGLAEIRLYLETGCHVEFKDPVTIHPFSMMMGARGLASPSELRITA